MITAFLICTRVVGSEFFIRYSDIVYERSGEYGKRKKVGEELMLMLIQKLVDDNRFDDISKIRDDQEYRQRLYKEYGIII